MCLKYAILSARVEAKRGGRKGRGRRRGEDSGAMKYREMRLSRVDGAKGSKSGDL